jgi:predicted phage terminase large subunit-like protein
MTSSISAELSNLDDRIKEMTALLDDPEIGEVAKQTIREGLRTLVEGGFSAAYDKQLMFRSRTDLDAYSEYVFEKKPFVHHQEITKVLMDESKKRVLIIAPPGHAKSTYVSLVYPSYHIGKHPDDAAIMVSNTATQSSKFTASIREIIASNKRYRDVFPEAQPDKERGWTREELFLSNRKDKTRPDPCLFATGMTGPVLGRRAELIIVDDPTSQQDAQSETVMEQQKLWFKQTLMSRLKPGGRCIVILTRWHDKDLASMLIHEMDFEVVHMVAVGDEEHGAYVDYLPPGEQPKGDVIDPRLLEKQKELRDQGFTTTIAKSHSSSRKCVRKYLNPNGERALWATEHNLEALLRIKQDYGTVQFNLVYQGDPTGLSGDVFKRDWFRYYGGDDDEIKKVPKDAYYFQSVDVAISTKESADYTVVSTVAVDTKGNYYIVDVQRERLEAPDQPKLLAKKYREFPQTMWILIENVAVGMSLFQNVVREGVPCRPYRPFKDKVLRARSAAAFFEAKKVYVKRNADWREDFVDEFTAFPRGEHDDQVDTISSLFEELAVNMHFKPVEYEIGFGFIGDDD